LNFLGDDKRKIGKIELEDYQADAVKDVYNRSYEILTEESKKQVLLHAPVGSGKTVMGAFIVNFFKKQMEELGYNEPVSFIWISPDTGGINEQSKDSFLKILENVKVLDVQQGKTESKIPEKSVLFINWEKLTKSGNLMKEYTEKVNFEDILKNTESKRVLIIDEAHIDWTKSQDSKVIDIINPDLTINLTATPDKRLIDKVEEEDIIHISYRVVQDAGVIKKRIIVNDGIDDGVNYQEDASRTGSSKIPLLDVEQLLLDKAIDKRENLEVVSKKMNQKKYLKPLVLIQIPNAGALESISLDYVYNFLISKGIIENKIGIWLSEVKKNIDDISNSSIEYLITKQAVATGWDCPRAHILVKLRETGSANFDIQTLGRVMRIPRGLDYSNEDLETAYIYTPHKAFDYRGNISDAEKRAISELTEVKKEANLKEEFKAFIQDVLGEDVCIVNASVPMYKRVRTKEIALSSEDMYSYLKNEIEKGELSFKTVATTSIKSTEIIDNFDVDNDLSLSDGVKRKALNFPELKRIYMRDMARAYNIINIEPYITNILYNTLIKRDKSIEKSSYSDAYRYIYTLYYNNKDKIGINIEEALKRYERDKNILHSSKNEYSIQKKMYLGPTKKPNDRYSYDAEPNLDKESSPEEKFQIYLNNNENIKYWFKNGLTNKDFSIVYSDRNSQIREYYPDFIAFDENKNVYILDTKANFGDDDFQTTKLKYEAGLEYVKNHKSKFEDLGFKNIIFSMIKFAPKGTDPYILYKDKYTDDINDWEPLAV